MNKDKQILVIGKFDKESFASHIVQTLQHMGYEPLNFHYGVHYLHKKGKLAFTYNKLQLLLDGFFWNTAYYEKKVERRLSESLKGKQVMLTIVTHDFLKPAEVELLKTLTKGPVVLWFPDALVNMARHMFLNAPFDLLFFKDPFLVKRLQADFPEKKVYYLPECCNPLVHKLYEPVNGDAQRFACDITTAGNLYANRVAFFEQLVDLNLDIRIWGNPGTRWMNLGRIHPYLRNEYIMERDKGLAFQMAKIVLNNLHPGEVAGINCRAFEIPAMGGFQMINWRNGLEDLFEVGKEIVAFRSLPELKEQIDYYLRHDDERAAIAASGYKRVHAEHTYAKRLEVLIDAVYKNTGGFRLPKD